ncbi:hypothetical protein OIPHN330_57420 (plasmid) [Citrobacter freundii]|uniref:hypothetical protein n=1 Tax=Enterobacteriaceae TaxID=543 RepID=UPI001250B120|nr:MULTISPECIES: hypothetical protein [Enterobacteriaceae]BEJ31037.1 hypothetical protein OIPH1902010_44730 [Escherichia coli]BEJ37122.1 hypothetical protein OIPHN330_57420 [Citrobacter freundii]BBK14881.1 hypothetical protein TMSI_52730 [Klebsiella quasipneumoniae]BBM27886.1 hypothetical protein OIPHN069_44010 [Enterobacter hormaechei subsp. hoffmannii]BEJ43081.1 hypothetical protein OIPHN354_57930 [Citrobacter freundii]
MSLRFIARVLRQLAIMFVLSVLIMAGYIYYAGKQHQQAAINFWGEQYQPDAISTQIDWGFIGNWVIPRGGPIISPGIAGVCPNTPLPVVPLKIGPDGRGYVLCGIGSDAVATSFDVNDIQDEEIRNTLKTMFEEEFEKTVKGDKWTLKN